MDTGAQMEFVPSACAARSRASTSPTRNGTVVVAEGQAHHRAPRARELEATAPASSGAGRLPVGRIVARNMVDADTGEIVAKANDEPTEATAEEAATPASRRCSTCLHQRARTRAPYIARRWHRRT